MAGARWLVGAVAFLVAVSVAMLAAASSWSAGAAPKAAQAAAALPSGFTESVVWSGLYAPTNIRFSSDGRIFVAQKDGQIKEFDSLTDTTPTIVTNLSTEVDDYWDRGLLGMALDPNFPSTPYMYVLESYDAAIGGTAPRWNDNCPSPPGPTTDGCVISGRLMRLTLSGNSVTATKILIKDQWCQQYPSHSIGDLNFGADGALYVSGGDGASFTFADYGQGGGGSGSPTPKNACGDPPAGVGGNETPPTAEGGALRAQSFRRPSGEPVLLNGAVLRVDPATGDALPDNPAAGSSDANARRIVAYGFRNPYHFTIRPLSNDLWIGDVGWDTWEEIDRQPSPTSSVLNFGWPCYEGNGPQPGYQSAGLNLCTSLYSAGTATAPYFTYNHSAKIAASDGCATGSSSVTGLAFYTGTSNYPAAYNNGLFFADYARNCISFMPVGSNGLPDPTRVQAFSSNASSPVDLEIGPNGDLFYADINGTIREIKFQGGNNPPTAVATASPTTGTAPLSVNFDGSGSSDPDAGDTISYSWDLNGDGVFGDSTVAKPTFTYTNIGTVNAVLRVTDNHNTSTTSSPISITVTPAGGTSTFGTTTPGTLNDEAGTNYKEVSKFSAPAAGSVVKVTGYVSGGGAASGSQKVRAILYADSGGNPGTLLGVSNEVTITGGQAAGWVDFTFSTPVSIQAGTIWMGYIADVPNNLTLLRYSTVTNDLRYNVDGGGYADGPSNPFGASTTLSFHYSMYATYVPSGGTPNTPPNAVATASPTTGTAPLTVNFDGSGSSDPDTGDTITYSWDLNGDGTFGDSTVQKPSFTYTTPGTYNAVLRVTDNHSASTTSAPVVITVSPGGGGGTATFGTTTPGTLNDEAGTDFKEVSKFTAPSAVSVTKVTGYVSGGGATSGSQKVRAVMYADSGGNPGALLGVSNEVTITAGQPFGWVDFPFASPVAGPAGTVWMGYIAGLPNNLTLLRYSSVANDLKYNVDSGGYADGPSNPFGTPITLGFHYSMYATYTTGAANQPPVPTISSPSSSLTWKVGDLINFSGSGTDPEDGNLAASKLSWTLILHHCDPTGQTCHIHLLQTFAGVASGSFNAPDHGYPSYLELQLTATDSQGSSATTSVNLQPQAVNLTFASSPGALQIAFDGTAQATPFTLGAIVGSTHSLSAPVTQTLGGTTYTFSSWSDGGAATHNFTAPATATTYTATYTASGTNNPPTASATASPTSGTAPLAVNFDGSGSSDPDAGDTISYSWDLNGDGTFGDSTVQKPSFTYTTAGTYTAVLRVTDNHNASTLSTPITITVNPATTTTFGTTTPGTLVDTAAANVKEVSKFTAPQAGNVVKVTGYVSGLGAATGTQKVKAVIYANSGTNPGARLGVSQEVTITAGRAWGWVDFTFSSPVAIQAGTVWIGYIAAQKSDLTQLRWSSVANDLRFNNNTYSTGPSATFGNATAGALHYSIYGTYG
jgi:PKD repeat protein